MNWRKLNTFGQYLLNFPGCILIFVNCASATIGLLYLQEPFDVGFQYLPGIAALAYFTSRSLYSLDYGVNISRNEVLAYLFVFSTAISVAVQISLGIDAIDSDGLSALDYTVAMWVFNMFHFFAGAACNRASYKKSDIVAIVLLLLVVIPYITAPKAGLFFDYWLLRQATGLENFTHLTISEWCVFFFVGAFAFASDKLRPIVIITSVICLFGMQGRSSTVFSLFTFLLFWLLTGKKKVVFTYICVGAVAVILLLLSPASEQLLSENDRALERMLLDSEDSSLEARANIFWESLQYLPKMILYGDPSYIALEAGRMGSYIHNILSMWQFFGLAPFVLILILLTRSLLVMRNRLIKGNLSVMEEIACMLLIYASVSVVFSKSVVFYWLWFAVGYWMLQYAGKGMHSRKQPKNITKKRKRRSRRRTKVQSILAGKIRF